MHYTVITEFTTVADGETSRISERFATIEAAYDEVDRVKADWQVAVETLTDWEDRYQLNVRVDEILDDEDGDVVTVGELRRGDRVAVGDEWRQVAHIHPNVDGGIVVELVTDHRQDNPGMWHYQYDVLGEALIVRQPK